MRWLETRPRRGILGRVTTATATPVERSGPGISTALDKYAPQGRPRFEAELRDALARASDDLDVARVDEVLSRWYSLADDRHQGSSPSFPTKVPVGRPVNSWAACRYLSMSPTTKNIEPRIATMSLISVPGSSSVSTWTLPNDAERSLSRHGVFSPRETR